MSTVDWQAVAPSWLGNALLHGMLVTDIHLTVRFWNDWLVAHSGYAAPQAIGRSLIDLYPDLAARGLLECYRRALAGETVLLPHSSHGYLLRMSAPHRRDLAHMPQDAQIVPLRHEGAIIGAVTTVADQTSRIVVGDEALFTMMNTALAQAPVGFGLLDGEMRFRAVNARLAQLNDMPVDAHLGHSLAELFPYWADELEPMFRRAFDEGKPDVGVQLSGGRRARPDQVGHWQASYFPVELGDGRRLGVGVLVDDITEQKRDEAAKAFLAELSIRLAETLDYGATLQRLARLTVPALADWCIIDMADESDRLSAVAHVDPGQARLAEAMLCERTPRSRAAGAPPPWRRPMLIADVASSPLDSLGLDAGALQLVRSLSASSCVVVPFSSGGQMIGDIVLARGKGRRPYTRDDLALAEEMVRRAAMAMENVRLYTAAEHSRLLAEEAVRVRDGFFSIAAHELRTPLTTLLGRAQMLQRWIAKDGGVDERSQRTIQIVVAQAQRLNKMITALLDVSRIQAGRFSIETAPMDLAALVRRVVDESRLTLADHTVILEGAQAPAPIEGDEVRLEQMLQNLIGNAIKYSPGGGLVTVRLALVDGFAVVSVSDQGIGISPDAQRQLFHRFYRAENAESHGISGMGIGLFVVKEIVELHGGLVAVESAEGLGSTFTARLPLSGG